MSFRERLRELVIPALCTLFGAGVGFIVSQIREHRKTQPVKKSMGDSDTTWKTFVERSRSFFDANRGSPMFQLIEMLDEMYRAANAVASFPKGNSERDALFRMGFLICHRALLAAATSTGSGLPEDGAAATRRALEAAKVCLAVKADPNNFTKWRATEERLERWKSRGKGERPKGSVNPEYTRVSSEPLYEDLKHVIGVLSDFTVHLTPEHVLRYKWGHVSQADGASAIAFGLEEDAVPKELLMLVGQHRLILQSLAIASMESFLNLQT